MTYRENVKAILECDFSQTKEELIDIAVQRICELTPAKDIGHCKDCRWWKDSDGAFRRGIEAESICPINTLVVQEGDGYCYMFEPQESEDKE